MSAAAGPAPLVARVEPARIAEDTWRLVQVPSPTGSERAAALLYAELLREAGAEVVVDEALPASPSVIGRLRGSAGSKGSAAGRVLQLAGHIDAIDVPHAPPARLPGLISGRGSADMKAGLAAILEVTRLLAADREAWVGELLVTVYGLHEAPRGHGQTLAGLIERGVTGDAAIVFEGPPGAAIVRGKGQSIWTITLARNGDACHELRRKPSDDQLLDAALALCSALREENLRLAAFTDPLLGPASIFTGQVHYGDFYNRAPRTCFLQGTRRWLPGKTFDDARADLDRVVLSAGLPAGISVSTEWTFVGESYAVDPEEPIVTALRDAWQLTRGEYPPLGGVSSVLDTHRLVPLGRVPTVPVDCDGATGHADFEQVRIPTVTAGCELALQTALCFLSPARAGAAS